MSFNALVLAGSRGGVFLGLSAGDYFQLMRDAMGAGGFDAYTASGTAHSIACERKGTSSICAPPMWHSGSHRNSRSPSFTSATITTDSAAMRIMRWVNSTPLGAPVVPDV